MHAQRGAEKFTPQNLYNNYQICRERVKNI